MKKCISCGSKEAKYEHFSGGFVCEHCMGDYFTCPKCGRLFDLEDRENGDAGSGFCTECTQEYGL